MPGPVKSLLFVLLSPGLMVAQSSSPTTGNASSGQQPAAAGGVATFEQAPVDVEMHAVLDTPLSSKTSRPGDRFTASVSEPLRSNDGALLVPVGARVEGEVAGTDGKKLFPALRGKGTLNLRFRDIVLPSGQTVPLSGSLVSVNSTGNQSRKTSNLGQVQSGDRDKNVARDVGLGAGLGTVARPLFGAPLQGLAIGVLSGGGYVLATKGKDVNLPAQTGLVIRFNQPLSVPRSRSL